jgi:hypothetical protein
MVRYSVKYQTISQKTKLPTGGTMGINVNASGILEARQIFKYKHPDNANVKYRIVGVMKTP